MISEGMTVCASDCCQKVDAKGFQVIVLNDCGTKWVELGPVSTNSILW